MGILSRARDWIEEKVDRVKTAARNTYAQRAYSVARRADTEYRQYVRETREKESRGEISPELARKRIRRAEEKYAKEREPIEKRVARRAATTARDTLDVMYAPGESRHAPRIRRGLKRAYTAHRSVNASLNAAFSSGFGKVAGESNMKPRRRRRRKKRDGGGGDYFGPRVW